MASKITLCPWVRDVVTIIFPRAYFSSGRRIPAAEITAEQESGFFEPEMRCSFSAYVISAIGIR